MVSLRKWLDTHPLVAILGVGVAVASTTTAVTTYFAAEVYKNKELEITNKYNSQISDLTLRLSSIERRAGQNDNKKYFDVQSIQVSSSEIKNLTDKYRSFDSGGFFLNSPAADTWKYAILTEGQIGRMGPLKSIVELAASTNPAVQKLMETSKAHVWYSNPAAEVKFDFASGLEATGPLTPYISLMKISRNEMIAKISAVAGVLGTKIEVNKSRDVTAAIDNIDKVKAQAGAAEGSQGGADSAEAKSELNASFERLFDADTTALVFVDTLVRMSQLSVVSPAISFSINSAQKQLNVMYIDSELRIANATVTKSFDQSCEEGRVVTVIDRREFFFISYGGGGYVIQTDIPTCDGRSRAFDWVSQWLAGLKIAVKGVS